LNSLRSQSVTNQEFNSRWPSIYLLGLAQAASMWGVAPAWLVLSLCLLVGVVWIRPNGLPSPVRFLITLVLVFWFFLYYRLSFTVEVAASFLWLSATLKMIELKARKDLTIFVYVMLYVAAVSLLFHQSISHVLLICIIIMLSLSILLRMQAGPDFRPISHFGSLARLFVLSIPVVVVLFAFFPRISPLWSMPIKAGSASTGISDSMSPGDIADLANSDERAFRASFFGDDPQRAELYWRGLVLDRFDGRRWSKSAPAMNEFGIRGKYDIGSVLESDSPYYQVMLEPHNNEWLFTLEGSSSLSTQVRASDMGLYVMPFEVIQAARYRMSRKAPVAFGDSLRGAYKLIGVDRQKSYTGLDLQLPSATNPRIRHYVQGLRQQYARDQDLVAAILKMFRTDNFRYTLKPGLLGTDFVDEFIFDTKRGFCSHYAGSMAFMLRLVGIPARVVIGYQGGEYVEDGDYYIVRQYDAHAWVEAKLNGIGWVRLDPTASVAPSRIEQNLQQAVSAEGTFLQNNIMASLRHEVAFLGWLSLKTDQLNYQWQKYVVNYGQDDQYGMIKKWLGEYSLSRVAALFGVMFGLVSMIILAWVFLRIERPELNVRQKRYLRWLSILRWFGYSRAVGETPRVFLARLNDKAHPWLASHTAKRTRLLEQNEYQHGDD
jgi:transglutaminase-like putative cysteine protease